MLKNRVFRAVCISLVVVAMPVQAFAADQAAEAPTPSPTPSPTLTPKATTIDGARWVCLPKAQMESATKRLEAEIAAQRLILDQTALIDAQKQLIGTIGQASGVKDAVINDQKVQINELREVAKSADKSNSLGSLTTPIIIGSVAIVGALLILKFVAPATASVTVVQ